MFKRMKIKEGQAALGYEVFLPKDDVRKTEILFEKR